MAEFREIYQMIFEELEKELGREPTHDEVLEDFKDFCQNIRDYNLFDMV